jgi:hypothetical protein
MSFSPKEYITLNYARVGSVSPQPYNRPAKDVCLKIYLKYPPIIHPNYYISSRGSSSSNASSSSNNNISSEESNPRLSKMKNKNKNKKKSLLKRLKNRRWNRRQ